MSMTFGPTVPDSTGNSVVLPCSVRVTVSCDASAFLLGEILFIDIPFLRRAGRRLSGDASHGRPAASDSGYVALQIYQVQVTKSS